MSPCFRSITLVATIVPRIDPYHRMSSEGIEAALAQSFGSSVLCAAAPVSLEADAYKSELFREEQQLVENAVPKRQNELAVGRVLARRLLERLGFATGPLLARPDRVPRWPPGAVGSISHTNGLCVCVVARASDAIAIGVDVEEDSPLDKKLWPLILRARERAL